LKDANTTLNKYGVSINDISQNISEIKLNVSGKNEDGENISTAEVIPKIDPN